MRLIRNISTSILALGALVLTSCSENLDVDNNPAIQAQLNGEFYKAVQTSAINNEDGTVSIMGTAPVGTVSLNLESSASGIYFLGPGANSTATFSIDDDTTYSTEFGSGRGELDVFRTDTPNTISAEFSFIAYNQAETDSIYMRQGIAYQVPFNTGFFVPDPGTDQFSAAIDGIPYVPTSIFVDDVANELFITGLNGAAELMIQMPNDIALGNYPLDGSNALIASYSDGLATSFAISGNLIVTAHDTTNNIIAGTFEFMTGAPDNFNVTGGIFSVSY